MSQSESAFESVLTKVERYSLAGGLPGSRRALSACPCCLDDGGYYAEQPIGDDGPSLTIIEDVNGQVHLTCMNGCQPAVIYAELGIDLAGGGLDPPRLRAREALELLWLEFHVLHIAAHKFLQEQEFTPDDLARIEFCANRLDRVRTFYRG